jgi:tRNA uridine 5-carbamoylmethylation protein Kti12
MQDLPQDAARFLLVALCGLPGCGKSTLARAVAAEPEPVSGRALDVRVVSFDAFEAADSGWSPETWHAGRAAAHASVASSVASLSAAGGGDDAPLAVLLVDDNAWYRSMRRAHYCTVREANGRDSGDAWAYATLYLACPLPLALARNAQRPASNRVPPDVIEGMHGALQPPSTDGDWESGHAVTIDASAALDGTTATVLEWLRDTTAHGPRASRHVPRPVVVDGDGGDEARAATAASVLHSAELLLRGHVGREIAAAPGAQRAALGPHLAGAKTRAWAAIRGLARSGLLAALLEGSGEGGQSGAAVLAAVVGAEWQRARAAAGDVLAAPPGLTETPGEPVT